jgi:hypothetical protein
MSFDRTRTALPPVRQLWSVAFLAVTLTLTAGCATTGPTGPLQPLVVGWEQHASIDYQVAPRGSGSVVWGYLRTGSPYTFHRIRVLVDALDASNQIVAQQIAFVPGNLASPSGLYFEVPMPTAAAYRVSVFSWDRLEPDGRRQRLW